MDLRFPLLRITRLLSAASWSAAIRHVSALVVIALANSNVAIGQINYINIRPTVLQTPDRSKLKLQTYTRAPQFLMGYAGDLKVLDTSRKFDPDSWGYGYQLDSDRDTYNEFYANQQLLYALESGQQSIANVLASFLGLGPNQFQDYSRAAAIRSILMSRNPLAVVEYGDSELSPDALDRVRGLIEILSPVVNQETRDPDALTPRQKRLLDAENRLLYADIRNTAKTDLGFSVRNGLLAQSNWYSLLLGDSELNIARGMDDILAIRNRVDLSFNPDLWWNALDPKVRQGFLDNNITSHLIYSAPNADEANIRINEALVKNDVQLRVAQYKPTWVDEGRMLVDNLVGGITNSPAAIPFVALGTIAAASYFWLRQRKVHAQSAAKKLCLHERVSE